MRTLSKLSRAKQVLENEGVATFVKKTTSTTVRVSKRNAVKVLPKSLRQKIHVQDDEYLFVSNPIFQITEKDIVDSKKTTSQKRLSVPETANWFVPYFDHLSYGGIYTIFRFIAHMQTQGVHNTIVIYDNPGVDVAKMKAEIEKEFPELTKSDLIIMKDGNDLDSVPNSDLAFCTFWVSAYILLKFNRTKKKYYFIQDYEPLFYTAGATYALAESTYRFGFRAIVNTPGLLAAVNKRHGQEGISFVPAVDRSIYFPAQDDTSDKKRIRIFFYARPNNPRNAFYLGIGIIKQLIDTYGSKIEIVTAGAEWNERKYGLGGNVTNLGLIKSISEVADLYRTCDIGFVYMLTKHPSYQPFEFMASGMATVTNNNEDNVWMLKHEENCLLAEPSTTAMAEQIGRLIDDASLRARIVNGGLNSVKNEWDWQTKIIWNDILKSGK